MTKELNGAGFNILKTDPSIPPDYQDNTPNSAYDVHAGEQNTRQGVTLHPKED